MRAGKAYISSLGTTGLLIASSVLLLLVVGAFVAFDSWPTQATAVPEEVAIGDAPRPEVVRSRVPDRADAARHSARIRARRTRARRAKSHASDPSAPGGRVLAALPAPAVGPRHLPDPAQPTASAAPPDARPSQPASVAPPPLPLLGQPVVLPAGELPGGSATLDAVVKRIADTKLAGGR
jgi:hypothetical protein